MAMFPIVIFCLRAVCSRQKNRNHSDIFRFLGLRCASTLCFLAAALWAFLIISFHLRRSYVWNFLCAFWVGFETLLFPNTQCWMFNEESVVKVPFGKREFIILLALIILAFVVRLAFFPVQLSSWFRRFCILVQHCSTEHGINVLYEVVWRGVVLEHWYPPFNVFIFWTFGSLSKLCCTDLHLRLSGVTPIMLQS